jgi:integrase
MTANLPVPILWPGSNKPRNACAKAKLTGKTPHISRHTFASRLAMSGVNSITLQKLGRWEDPKMLQRYAHLSNEHLAEALEKIQPAQSNLVTDFTPARKSKSGGAA